MKLNLLFIVMDLFTVLVYPFVFIHGKLLQLSKERESISLAKVLVTASVATGK
jgi:hypothetical protein